jgi:hypothetical protein
MWRTGTRPTIADEPVLGILIFMLLKIQHQIKTALLGWNTFPLSIKTGAIIFSRGSIAASLRLHRRE